MITGKKSHSDVLQQAFKACLYLALLDEVATNTLPTTAVIRTAKVPHPNNCNKFSRYAACLNITRPRFYAHYLFMYTVCVSDKLLALCVIYIMLFCTEVNGKKGKKYHPLRNQKSRNTTFCFS